MATRMWLGGSSALAQTYLHTFPDEAWILLGHKSISSNINNCVYVTCDLTNTTWNNDNFWKLARNVEQLVIGIRPPLVSYAWQRNDALLQGLEAFMQQCIVKLPKLKQVLHISSIAAIDHLAGQVNVNESDMPEINKNDLHCPYDYFKRHCEDLVENSSMTKSTTTTEQSTPKQSPSIQVINLRLGAIFSDTPSCIQCQALNCQYYIGCRYFPTRIDCNSSRNVAWCIQLLLSSSKAWNNKVYYYTRPATSESVPYGSHLDAYRSAYNNNNKYCIDVPFQLVQAFVAIFHFIVNTFGLGLIVPYLASIDYLLQVSKKEHTFDLTRIRKALPELAKHEESIQECFIRRRAQLEGINRDKKCE